MSGAAKARGREDDKPRLLLGFTPWTLQVTAGRWQYVSGSGQRQAHCGKSFFNGLNNINLPRPHCEKVFLRWRKFALARRLRTVLNLNQVINPAARHQQVNRLLDDVHLAASRPERRDYLGLISIHLSGSPHDHK